MGLIYASADSSQLITALKTNISNAKQTTNQLKSGSQKVVSAVDGRTLAGAAYTAGKGLFSELVIPTIARVTTAFDQLEQELNMYQSADSVIRGEGSYLDEEILKKKIEAKKAQKRAALASVSTLTNQIKLAKSPEMSSYIRSTQKEMNRLADSLDDEIRQLEKKIEALYTFSSSTKSLFSNSLNELKVAMQSITILSNTSVNSDGIYKLPSGIDYNLLLDMIQTTGISIASDQIEKQIGKIGVKRGLDASLSIWNNRYSIKLDDGRILGRVPGATSAARESAAKNVSKNIGRVGKAATEAGGTLVGVGISMWQGDTAEEAWGKELITGLGAAGVTWGIGAASSVLATAGIIANPIGIGVVGTIAIATGVGMVNDLLREEFDGVKKFEDNVGNAVVSGWRKLTKKVGSIF